MYTQEDPKISTYETSYLAETPINLPEMKQQIRIAITDNGRFVKDFDPRAVSFIAKHHVKTDGLYNKVVMDLDWCDPKD